MKDFCGGLPNHSEHRAVSRVAVAMATPLFLDGSESATTLYGTGEVRADLSKTRKRYKGAVAVVAVLCRPA